VLGAARPILRAAVDIWPLDKDAAAGESMWLAERLAAVDGDELYDRYLRLFDKINGTDLGDIVLTRRYRFECTLDRFGVSNPRA
jgi:hypothetical protein